LSNKIIDTSVFSDGQMSSVKSENELQLAAFELNKVVKRCYENFSYWKRGNGVCRKVYERESRNLRDNIGLNIRVCLGHVTSVSKSPKE